MTGEHLDAVAIAHINQERTVSPEKVLQVWDRSGDRKIALAFNEQ